MLKAKDLILISMVLFTSCKTTQHVGSTMDEYVMAYKKAVLYGCLNDATNKNFSQFMRENNDLGLAVETAVLFHHEVLKAQELGSQLSENIRTINYSDYKDKKPIFSDCIEFAFSEFVDSIAKHKYKTLKKKEIEYITE